MGEGKETPSRSLTSKPVGGFSPCRPRSRRTPLWHKLLRESSFFLLLLKIDRELAEQVRGGGCPHCGSALHAARYWRAPRGAPPDLPEDYDRRESFCCSAEGCRKRVLPPSLRFFGRRVYLGPVFVLACAMMHGINEERAVRLGALVGVSRRTLLRWRSWWLEVFPHSGFWQGARGRFGSPVDPVRLPASLLERFGQPRDSECALGTLKFLAPLTGGSGSPRGG